MTARTSAAPERARWAVRVLDPRPADALLEVGCGPGLAADVDLCWTRDPGAELRVLRAALRPGGRLHLLHGAAAPAGAERVVAAVVSAVRAGGFTGVSAVRDTAGHGVSALARGG